MKKLQICLSLAALMLAASVQADLGPWEIGYTNPSDVIAYIEVINGDSTLRIYPDALSTTHCTQRFWAYEYGTTNVPWENEALHIHHVVVERGIAEIEDCIFYSMKNVQDIYISSSVNRVSEGMFDNTYAYNCNMYCDRETIIRVSGGNPAEDYDAEGKYIKRPYHSSMTVFVPSEEAVAAFRADPLEGGADWWYAFNNISATTINFPKAVVEPDSIKDTKATITVPLFGTTEEDRNSVTYTVKVTNLNDASDIHDFDVKYSASEDKWVVLQNFGMGGNAPRRMPVIRRDTVSRTTETLQIDITSLKPASTYSYEVTAVNAVGETVSHMSGAIKTPAKQEAMGVESVDQNANRKSSIRKLLIGGQLYILRDGRTYSVTGEEVQMME